MPSLLARLIPINRQTLRALRHRNYRLFYWGQGISLIGTWLQQVALQWLTYRLTGSAFLLGVVGFLGQVPTLFLSPIAGWVSDRYDRQRILIVAHSLAMCQAFALAVLTLGGWITVGQIVGLSVFMGIIVAFEVPVRQAFVFQMIDNREDIGNAVALNSSLVNLARIIGPAMAGVLIWWIGEGGCFLLNAMSFIAVLISLWMMRPQPQPAPEPGRGILANLTDGFRYTLGFPPIRDLILLLAMTSIMSMAFVVLMPVYVDRVLHGGAGTLGFLMTVSGVGALLGAVHLAARPSVLGLGRLIPIGCAVLGGSMIVFGATDNLWVAMGARFVGSVGLVVQMAASNTILQTITDDRRRGRVMAMFAMAFIGMAPVGSLVGGAIAEHLGIQRTLLLTGGATLLAAALFAYRLPHLRNGIRPIYQRLGILPPPAPETESAS